MERFRRWWEQPKKYDCGYLGRPRDNFTGALQISTQNRPRIASSPVKREKKQRSVQQSEAPMQRPLHLTRWSCV